MQQTLNRIPRKSLPLAALAASLAFAATVGAITAARDTSRTHVSEPVPIRQASPEQEALLRRIVSSLGAVQISEIRIASTPADFKAPGSSWIEIDVSATSQPDGTRGFWQALVVAGIFRDLSAARGLPAIAGKTIVVSTPEGLVLDEGSSLIEQPTSHAIRSERADVMKQLISERLAATGLREKAVEVHHPNGRAAVEIVAETSEPRAFLADRQTRLRALMSDFSVGPELLGEGAFVRVITATGRTVLITGYAARTGEGVGWIDPNAADTSLGGIFPRD